MTSMEIDVMREKKRIEQEQTRLARAQADELSAACEPTMAALRDLPDRLRAVRVRVDILAEARQHIAAFELRLASLNVYRPTR